MSLTKRLALGLSLLSVLPAARAADTPLPAPVIFAPGIISGPANDGAPTFTPDGNTLYFTRSGASWGEILESHRTAGTWSQPEIASFSGPSSDLQPSLSPDGRTLVYASWRVNLKADGTKEMVADLWRVDRAGTGWSTPVHLPPTVNIARREFKPSLAANGDLYFMATDGPGGAISKFRLYRAAWRHGAYQQAQPLSFSDGTVSDVDAFIAPDSSYLIFSSKGRRTPDDDHEHLFIAFRNGEGWSPPQPIRYDGDALAADDGEAQVSPDGKTLYFTSSRTLPMHQSRDRAQMLEDFARLEAWDNSNNNVWTLPLTPYLALKPS